MGRTLAYGLLLSALRVLSVAADSIADEPADLVVLGCRIVTLDPQERVVAALAVREGRIVAMGADADIERLIDKD